MFVWRTSHSPMPIMWRTALCRSQRRIQRLRISAIATSTCQSRSCVQPFMRLHDIRTHVTISFVRIWYRTSHHRDGLNSTRHEHCYRCLNFFIFSSKYRFPHPHQTAGSHLSGAIRVAATNLESLSVSHRFRTVRTASAIKLRHSVDCVP